jgi:hypothetical protein
MKFRITMKDPDGVHDGLTEADKSEGAGQGFGYDERVELLKKWFKYREYLTVEIDTDAKTIVVVDQK